MHQKRRDYIMLIACFLRKTLIFTNTAPDAKKARKLVICVKHVNYIGVKRVI